MLVDGTGTFHGSIEQQALVLPLRHTRRQCAIQKARPDLGIGHTIMLPDSDRSSIWTGELEPAPLPRPFTIFIEQRDDAMLL